MRQDRDIQPWDAPSRDRKESLATDLLLSGVMVTILAWALATILRGIFGSMDPVYFLVDSFATFGFVGIWFSARRFKQLAEAPNLSDDERATLVGSAISHQIASCGALFGGVFVASWDILPGLIVSIVGHAGTFACAFVIDAIVLWKTITIPKRIRMPTRAGETEGRPIALHIPTSTLGRTCMYCAALFAYFAPAITCIVLSMD